MATLEEEVAGLTTATTDLLTAVNVKKATLDDSVAEATAQAATATTKAGEASADALTATTEAAEAVAARADAVAVVYSGDASVTPAAGKIPVARADNTLDPEWLADAGSQRNPIIYDGFGDPNVMVRIPKFNVEDIDASLGTGVHPAFIVNGVEKDAIYISKYLASALGSNYVSMPDKDPATSINFDNALSACAAKGAGWHLMTNAEYAAIALWSWKNGTMPHGNNNYGRDVDNRLETGRLTQAAAILGASGTARTATGTGPATWSHDHTTDGIFDLNGNVYEWSGGMRLNDGEIQVLANNNAADNTKDQSATSAEWQAISSTDGSLVAPATVGSLKYDATGAIGAGAPLVSDTILSQSDGSTYSYTYLESLAAKVGLTVPAILKQLALYPVGTGLGGNRIYVRNIGERLPVRGGYWYDGSNAGVFMLDVHYGRSLVYSWVGFRAAFVL